MGSDAEGFVERFRDRWSRAEPEGFADLFHPNGTLLHPGMDCPIVSSQVPAYFTRVKSVLPDIRLEVKNWASSGNAVLIAWTITATFRGEPVEWSGTDRFTLRGDRAIEGIAYFDTFPIRAAIDPSLKQGDLLGAVAVSTAGLSA